MDNKHRKLFVIKQSKGANLCLKCTTIWRQGPDPLAAIVRGERDGRRKGMERQGEEIPFPKVKVKR